MIRVKNLKKVFPDNTVAVEDFSLHVLPGTISCLIGSSGCGKTTSLKMINRIIEPSSGTIEVNGVLSEQMNDIQWRRKIGYVIQKTGLFPHMTVMENISILSKVLKKDSQFIKNRVNELLELVGLEPNKYKNRYPIELSGGQGQRVGIARALMEDPAVLLMDEPFGALDAITKASLRKEFLSLNQKLKKTILIVTHDLNEAFQLGDQIALMRKGQLVQTGTKTDFINNPANQFVKDFFNEVH